MSLYFIMEFDYYQVFRLVVGGMKFQKIWERFNFVIISCSILEKLINILSFYVFIIFKLYVVFIIKYFFIFIIKFRFFFL